MNLCAFSCQNGYVKNFSHKINHQSKLEEILAHFYLPNAKLEFDSHDASNDWLSVGITSAQGWRIQQEDAHICDLRFDHKGQLALFGVFDGHNGYEIAHHAAKMLPEYIKSNQHFRSQQYGMLQILLLIQLLIFNFAVQTLEQSFLEFDGSLLEEKNNQALNQIRFQFEMNNPQFSAKRRNQSPLVALNTGCTAVVALLSKTGQFYVANIGDSRCVLCVKGKIFPLSKDHKPTDPVEKRRIEQAGCHVVNGRINHGLNLSRAFGDHVLKNQSQLSPIEQAVSPFPDVTVCKEKIKHGDFMVLACDGIWNCMSNKEVCTLVRKNIKKGVPLSKICELLVHKCVSPVRPIRGQIGGDNMTCIIVRFNREIH